MLASLTYFRQNTTGNTQSVHRLELGQLIHSIRSFICSSAVKQKRCIGDFGDSFVAVSLQILCKKVNNDLSNVVEAGRAEALNTLQKFRVHKMSFVNVKKHYLVIAMLVFLLIFIFHSRPAFQCQFTTEVASNLPIVYGITPTYERLAQKADLTSGQFITEVRGDLPIIYGITPTYERLTQKADLTRLSQTLMLVKNFHWIVIEDAETKTSLVSNLLNESGLVYTHLNVKTHKAKHSMASGVEQRNIALDWLRKHLATLEDRRGVVYFMDDDNTYALKVFDEMRKVRKVGVWPVGIVGGMRVEMPLVTNGVVTGYNAVWKPFRPFPLDMAGFAINATLFLEKPDAKFSRRVQSGFQESEILKFFATREDLEPLAENCTKVYVWHTRTQKPTLTNPKKLKRTPPPDSHIEV